MGTRLIVNVSQVYTPLYLVDSLNLPKVSGRKLGTAWLLQGLALSLSPYLIHLFWSLPKGQYSHWTTGYLRQWVLDYPDPESPQQIHWKIC